MNIAVVMSVCGAQEYFDCASISIPSLLRTCPGVTLYVITDRLEEIRVYGGLGDVRLIHYNSEKTWEDAAKVIRSTKSKWTEFRRRKWNSDGKWSHISNYIGTIIPIAQHVISQTCQFTHILKVDCDSYFAGEGYMDKVLEETVSGHELYLAQRVHPEMVCQKSLNPGVGFYVWSIKGRFARQYVDQYLHNEQSTINCQLKGRWKKVLATHPGYHFVYPFVKNPDFGKADAERFLPAYFHLNMFQANAYKNLLRMDRWFNE